MKIIEKAINADPPDDLFHYTSPEGLLGILTSGEFWASKIHFMNDAEEFGLALKLAREILSEYPVGSSEDVVRYRRELAEDIERFAKVNVFVFSFSEDGDLLSQWRAYCPPGGGYSVGFRASTLREAARRSGSFYFGRCVYNPDHQRDVVREVVERGLARRASMGVSSPLQEPPLRNLSFADTLIGVAPLLKHSAYAEEREWRLISRPMPFTDPRFSYRSRGTLIAPYYRLPFREAESGLGVERIVIGPTLHPELAEDALQNLANSLGIGSGCVIECSEVPYRTW